MCFTWSVCVFLFLLCYFHFLNKLDPSIIVWERDTLRFFMWKLIFFTYICWVFLSSYCNAFSSYFSCISCSELLVLIESTLLFLWWMVYRFLCSNKFIGVWLETKNATCCRWYMERHTHACRSLSLIIWWFAIVLSS